MHHLLTRAAALACASALCACAGVGSNGAVAARSQSAERAAPSLRIGQSTKAEVAAALGSATVTTFSSGYEVWVYTDDVTFPKLVAYLPIVGTVAGAIEMASKHRELAILFGPDGKVKQFEQRTEASTLAQLAGK